MSMDYLIVFPVGVLSGLIFILLLYFYYKMKEFGERSAMNKIKYYENKADKYFIKRIRNLKEGCEKTK